MGGLRKDLPVLVASVARPMPGFRRAKLATSRRKVAERMTPVSRLARERSFTPWTRQPISGLGPSDSCSPWTGDGLGRNRATMHVDRQRFILLASAIAAGCGAGEAVPTEVPVAPPRELAGGVDLEPAAEIPAEPDAPLPSNGSTEALRERLAKRCEALREPSGPFCEGFEETIALCPQFADMLRPTAAREAVACLTERSGSVAICGYEAVGGCFLAGLAAGSATAEAQQHCLDVMSNCRGSRWRGADLNETTCQRAVGAVRPDKVDDLVSCMTEGCGIQRCIYELVD